VTRYPDDDTGATAWLCFDFLFNTSDRIESECQKDFQDKQIFIHSADLNQPTTDNEMSTRGLLNKNSAIFPSITPANYRSKIIHLIFRPLMKSELRMPIYH
jgi:hypothetical protein